MQRLLSAAVWDDAGMRDDLRGYVVEHFADPGAVLVVDETGDLKRGSATVGTQRQYTGTAGRTENAQVAVYLAYAAAAGSAFIDRALYLPRSWTGDPARCRAAGVPAGTAFATKPALARQMITRALDAGTPAAWVSADEVYGQDPALRAGLARRGLGYVLAIPQRHLVITGIGARTAIWLAKRLPAQAWQRMSAGPGAKGPRWYDWALIEAADPAVTEGGGPHWLLIRRSISDGEYAFYRAHAPGPGAAGPAGEGRWIPLESRGRVRWRQGAGCPGRAPGPQLDLLAPVDHLGPARPRLFGRAGRHPGGPPEPGR
jgi:SRSO17 transposase